MNLPLPKTVVLDEASNMPKCTVHNRPLVYKAPGISRKTGKGYKGFYACPVKDHLGYCSSSVSTWQVEKLPFG